ncbi:MAG TPA: hypothetical protein V6D17_04900 [Candidatus Obscuribacterales bacterium]
MIDKAFIKESGESNNKGIYAGTEVWSEEKARLIKKLKADNGSSRGCSDDFLTFSDPYEGTAFDGNGKPVKKPQDTILDCKSNAKCVPLNEFGKPLEPREGGPKYNFLRDEHFGGDKQKKFDTERQGDIKHAKPDLPLDGGLKYPNDLHFYELLGPNRFSI